MELYTNSWASRADGQSVMEAICAHNLVGLICAGESFEWVKELDSEDMALAVLAQFDNEDVSDPSRVCLSSGTDACYTASNEILSSC
jgi:hypothetical protein